MQLLGPKEFWFEDERVLLILVCVFGILLTTVAVVSAQSSLPRQTLLDPVDFCGLMAASFK